MARLKVDPAARRAPEAVPGRWLPQFACPECGDSVRADGPSGFVCRSCVLRFERRDDVYRFLAPHRAEAAAAFLRQYHLVRERESYRSSRPEYYRKLPAVIPGDPRASEWQLRRESYTHLRRYALRPIMRGPIRALDLGAGNGWLSHRLASLGHDVVAVDQQDDGMDGLGACRHYELPFTAVQADFDALPFAPGQFDLAIVNGALHYSPDPIATLLEARRVLAPGGLFAIMDSPMFAREQDGTAMVERETRRLQFDHGLTNVLRPGVGFLTFAMLERAAAVLGVTGRYYRSRGPLLWRLRRQLGGLRLRRRPASFGVWVAR
jgi:SAM-dependent methyltransferase